MSTETGPGRAALRLFQAAACGMILISASAWSLNAREVRTRQAGEWEDWRTWEVWNAESGTWELLPEDWYPGCEYLRQVHVSVEHHVHLRSGMEVHVAAVTAVSAELLQVEGDLIVDIGGDYVDKLPPESETSAVAGIDAPAGSDGIRLAEVYPNPIKIGEGSRLHVVVGREAESPKGLRVMLQDEEGNMVAAERKLGTSAGGTEHVQWELSELASGTYFVVVEGPGIRRTRPVVVVK